ncbi:MAG: hypothetical protein R3B53_00625 [Candidatus Paceibacterota bacterium]
MTYDTEAAYKSKTAANTRGRANVMEMSELNELKALTDKRNLGPLNADDSARLEKLEERRSYLEGKANELVASVTDLSTKQMEDMTDEMLESIAENLTNSQVENFMKSDNVSAETKGKLIKARQAAITKVVGATGSIITAELAKRTIDEIETMGDVWIRDNVHLFTKPQMDELKKSKKFTEVQRNSYAQTRNDRHKDAAVANTRASLTELFTLRNSDGSRKPRKPEDIANLGRDVLMKDAAITMLSAADLEVIADKKTLTPTERKEIYEKVMDVTYTGANATALREYFRSPQGSRNWG